MMIAKWVERYPGDTSVEDTLSIATSIVMQEPGRTFILTNDASRSSRTDDSKSLYAAPEIREAGRWKEKHRRSRRV